MSIGQIVRIAENEFAITVRNPIVPVFMLLLLTISVIIAFGTPALISYANIQRSPISAFMIYGMGNSFYTTYLVFITLSVCLGIFSISDERLNGTLNTLICKPLYRKDIFAGKFLGVCMFILLSIIFVIVVLTSLTLMMFPAAGYGVIEIAMRMASYAVILFLICSMTLALTMLIGIVFKKTIEALALALTMVFIVLFTDLLSILGPLKALSPWSLFYTIFYKRVNMDLFDVSASYPNWLISSLPLIILLIAELVVVFLANCMMFNRDEAR